MNALTLFNPSYASDVFDVFDRGFFAPLACANASSPRVDVRETSDAYLMDMDLP